MPDKKKKLPPNIELEPLPFDEAIEIFGQVLPLTPTDFYSLAEAARAAAFTVASLLAFLALATLALRSLLEWRQPANTESRPSRSLPSPARASLPPRLHEH